MSKKAVILFSGGLDSTTVLAIAQSQGFECYALSFNYGQKHSSELDAAKKIAKLFGIKQHIIFDLDLAQFGKSALTDDAIAVQDHFDGSAIPLTYVPARNTIFFSIALGLAETLCANDIFAGVSSLDYSGYPDCRPEYINAFTQMANLATKAAVEGQKINIHTPLIYLNKAQTVEQGRALGVDYSLTVSCYRADLDGLACGLCDSCVLRKKGFLAANLNDPTRYKN